MSRKKAGELSVFLFCSISLFAQETKSIQLKNEKLSYSLKNYYINKLMDDRADTSNIGSARSSFLSSKDQPLNLENGVCRALTKFIRGNLEQDSAASPIDLHISQFMVENKGNTGLKTEHELTIGLAYYDGKRKLFENSGGGTTMTTGDPSKLIEELIRGSLTTLLHQFDEWWFNNKIYYEEAKTKPTIRVEVSLEQEQDDSTLISYSQKRPLALEDFRGRPDQSSSAAAVTYSIVILKYSSARMGNNEIIVDVNVSVEFRKMKSWCRAENRNEETLAHEQLHFDISAITACELVDTIRKFKFTPDYFPLELERIQGKKQRELDEMQDRYDSETKHAIGPAVQERWNRIIKEKLQSTTCFHS